MNSSASSCAAERALSLAGVLCVLLAMVLGYIYAAYIAHVANAGIREAWSSVMLATSQGDVELVRHHFSVIADLTERRGRIMNSHSHIGGSGLLLMLIAALQPFLLLGEGLKRQIAYCLVIGAVLQFAGVLLSYVAGGGYIYLADAGSVLLLVGVTGTLFGLVASGNGAQSRPSLTEFAFSRLQSASSRLLVKAAVLLIFILMLLGLYLAWLIVSGDEAGSLDSVRQSVEKLMQQDVVAAQTAIAAFKSLQTKMAINAAAHSHGIEVAILMLLLALLRGRIGIGERAFKVWCIAFAVVSYVFPLWIFLAINYSFTFAKMANMSGVTLALLLLILLIGLVKGNNSQGADA